MAAKPSVERDSGTKLELASAGDVETLARAHGTCFLVTNRAGDIAPSGARELGLFSHDTRFLSLYELSLEGVSLIHLSSDTFGAAANQIDLMVSGELRTLDDPQNYLHVRRRQLVDDGLCEEISLVNYLQEAVDVTLHLAFAADFADVFEVRGATRPGRGHLREPVVGDGFVELGYDGTDGASYRTRVEVYPKPERLSPSGAKLRVRLAAGESQVVEVHVRPSSNRHPLRRQEGRFDTRVAALKARAEKFLDESTRFRCDDGVLQHVLEQSTMDLLALTIDVKGHNVVAAGIPWFCCPFGRDTLLASYEALTLNPELAVSSLRALAAFQGQKHDDFTEEEPGKIFHELRFGEMAKSEEIPHSPYYGSVDATPLFVIVADATYRVTADPSLLADLHGPVARALGWIDAASAEGTELVTYAKRSRGGLDNQGWKDSRAGVSFPDGENAQPPIALCEVQGYCVDAYARGARLLRALGDPAAETYEARARTMRETVERALWLEDEGRYAYAVDGRGRVLPTVVSNLGHLLWSRVPDDDHARRTAELLVSPESLSAFGVRTLASGQAVYNPLSYHNGTVWPHDNAILAKGFSNYGLMEPACKVFQAIGAAMGEFRDRRLPELYCGMSKTAAHLVRYPVACSPQAWAAAAPFLLLQAVLGIHINGAKQSLSVRTPHMPDSVKRIEIEGLRVGSSRISLRIRRVGRRCHVDRLDVSGAPLRTTIEIT
jgi:glycogen debranching enzyme